MDISIERFAFGIPIPINVERNYNTMLSSLLFRTMLVGIDQNFEQERIFSSSIEKNLLLACLKDETLQLIDLRQNRVLHTMSNESFEVRNDTNKAILSPDGRYACAGSFNGSVLFWSTTDGVCEKVFHKKHTYANVSLFYLIFFFLIS